jgi:hypothetical protein
VTRGPRCRFVEVDGEPVLVRGDRPMNAEDAEAFAEVVRAARKLMGERMTDERLAEHEAKLPMLPMSATRYRAGVLLAELKRERARADALAEQLAVNAAKNAEPGREQR